jgi:hypothetical protein
MSIRQPGAVLRGPSLLPPTAVSGATVPADRTPRRPPDAGPLRLMMGVVGMASAAALTAAMLPSITPQAETVQDTGSTTATDVVPAPSVRHVTQYVTLKPGQTAPPQSTVIVQPQPTPKVTVKVVTKTRQSGR